MRRTNAQSLGEILRDYFEDNTELYEKIMDARIQRIWKQVLGPMVLQYTRNLYVRNRVLYVYMTSAVLRSELLFSKDRLKEAINKEIGSAFLFDLVIR